jgi:hypothetical protein
MQPFEAAIQDAKQQDEYFAKHKTPIGPLHGLPVSLKDLGFGDWLVLFGCLSSMHSCARAAGI